MNEEELANIEAQEIMSHDISTIVPMEKISTAEILMIKKNIGGLPVISPKSKELLGIITQRDIQLSRAVIGTQAFHVDDLYSKNPITATKNEKLPSIVKKMRVNNIERIPIIDNARNCVGIIVVSDIIRVLSQFFEENEFFQQYNCD